MILDTLNVNLAAIGIGASIIGVAVGFGAQSLVKDFISGVFMIVEDQYGVGDVIDTGVASGTVEGVSLRTTRLRDAEGWSGTSRTGRSCAWATRASSGRARCSTSPSPTTPTSSRRPTPSAPGPTRSRAIRSSPGSSSTPPEVLGVEQVTNDQVVIRLGVKTQPLEQWRVARALRARVKAALDDAGIRPLGESVITYRADGGPPTEPRPDGEDPAADR